jgi:hypothetical protein
MTRSVLERAWNRLVNRYQPIGDSDCCGPRIEEIQSESSEDGSEHRCE